MIDPETSKAVYLLHQQGMTLRQISRSLSIGRKAIRRIIQHQGVLPSPEPPNKIHIERELLERLYRECQGRIKRIHEKLVEEENVKVSYSTICRMLEKLEISKPTQTMPAGASRSSFRRCCRNARRIAHNNRSADRGRPARNNNNLAGDYSRG